MKKIKIAGALIFILSILLAIIFNMSDKHYTKSMLHIRDINTQKAFTQEVSKHIFYIYKHKGSTATNLDDSIEKFKGLHVESAEIKESKKLSKLWNDFFLQVQTFRDQNRVKSPYSDILIQKTVNQLYNTNLKLIVELDMLIELKSSKNRVDEKSYKYIQYLLFAMLFTLLLYLFSELKVLLLFMQKFLFTSKNIIDNSTIKGVKPIELNSSNSEIQEASKNFNTLLSKIDDSIKNSTTSLTNSEKSLELVQENIDEFLELISDMDEELNLTKKEDIIIEVLEELNNSLDNLNSLKKHLGKLV